MTFYFDLRYTALAISQTAWSPLAILQTGRCLLTILQTGRQPLATSRTDRAIPGLDNQFKKKMATSLTGDLGFWSQLIYMNIIFF